MHKKRFLLLAALLAALLTPPTAQAQDISGADSYKNQLAWRPLWMRSTAAATGSVVQELNWARGGHGQSARGFADSVVFRKGAATRTLVDTSAAYHVSQFPFPPALAMGGGTTALTDTSSIPWLIVRVRQDTTQASFAGTTGFDSLLVAAEFSYDGIAWLSVSGTPTRAFEATAPFAVGTDGLTLAPITTVEPSPGADYAYAVLNCHPQVVSGAFILNKTLCLCGGYVRFLIGVADGSGQFVAEYASWKQD